MPARYFEQTLPHSTVRFRMVHIPGGTFLMGSAEGTPEAEEGEFPQHEVTLSDFWMGEYLVTQALWQAVMGNNPSYLKGENRPVEQVNWYDSVIFCNRLSILTGRQAVYYTLKGSIFGLSEKSDAKWELINPEPVILKDNYNGFRLPTEAEWEYAAAGGPYSISIFQYSGSNLLEQVGWHTINADDGTRDVGLLLPNAIGLYDLSGNVWEWCTDWWIKYNAKHQINPIGPVKGERKIYRGGSWIGGEEDCRITVREKGSLPFRHFAIGLRLTFKDLIYI